MANFIKSVDERTQLAGANRLEVLLFSLGENKETDREEVFGINVFKVREVMHVPDITHAPDMPNAVEGMVSLRGTMVPVINMPKFCGVQTKDTPQILMITEYNQHVQGFLVHAVETIERLSWNEVKTPPPIIANRMGGLVTAVAELKDKRLVMIMDVERILAETAGLNNDESIFDGIESPVNRELKILFADDSSVARQQITQTFDHMGADYIATINGAEAWAKLNDIAARAEAAGRGVCDEIQLVLTDVEMPEMDGYVLTRKIKEDPRFAGIPIIMHSSLTAVANHNLGKGIGADAYVSKFQPRELAATILKFME